MDDDLEKKAKDQVAFWKLQSAFREFEDTYNGGERWYYKVKRAPEVYMRAIHKDNPTRFTILREDVEPSITDLIPQIAPTSSSSGTPHDRMIMSSTILG